MYMHDKKYEKGEVFVQGKIGKPGTRPKMV